MQSSPSAPVIVERYALYGEVVPGGAIRYGRLLGAEGFTRTVAVKVIPVDPRDPERPARHLAAARVAGRVRHPNLVPILDVVETPVALLLVMEYLPGETLERLMRPLSRRGERVPPRIACGLVSGVLAGLHAAHEAKASRGQSLQIVHGEVAPHNVLVAADGVPRMLDLGVAAATDGAAPGAQRRGRGYLAPEQLDGYASRASDVWAAGVVLWEALTGRPLFGTGAAEDLTARVRAMPIEPPSRFALGIPPELDAIVLHALRRAPQERYPTARAMASELDACVGGQLPNELIRWLEGLVGPELAARAATVVAIESAGADDAASGPRR